jgi:hypothetical protein
MGDASDPTGNSEKASAKREVSTKDFCIMFPLNVVVTGTRGLEVDDVILYVGSRKRFHCVTTRPDSMAKRLMGIYRGGHPRPL